MQEWTKRGTKRARSVRRTHERAPVLYCPVLPCVAWSDGDIHIPFWGELRVTCLPMAQWRRDRNLLGFAAFAAYGGVRGGMRFPTGRRCITGTSNGPLPHIVNINNIYIWIWTYNMDNLYSMYDISCSNSPPENLSLLAAASNGRLVSGKREDHLTS